MGFWKSARGLNGDSWADEMGRCMKALDVMPAQVQVSDGGINYHHITMQEFADLVEFCSRGHLVVEVRHPEEDSDRPLGELHDAGIETYPNRGQIHCAETCNVGKEVNTDA